MDGGYGELTADQAEALLAQWREAGKSSARRRTRVAGGIGRSGSHGALRCGNACQTEAGHIRGDGGCRALSFVRLTPLPPQQRAALALVLAAAAMALAVWRVDAPFMLIGAIETEPFFWSPRLCAPAAGGEPQPDPPAADSEAAARRLSLVCWGRHGVPALDRQLGRPSLTPGSGWGRGPWITSAKLRSTRFPGLRSVQGLVSLCSEYYNRGDRWGVQMVTLTELAASKVQRSSPSGRRTTAALRVSCRRRLQRAQLRPRLDEVRDDDAVYEMQRHRRCRPKRAVSGRIAHRLQGSVARGRVCHYEPERRAHVRLRQLVPYRRARRRGRALLSVAFRLDSAMRAPDLVVPVPFAFFALGKVGA